MGFKENLKSELQYKGILVKELATKSGVKKQTLDNYLSTHNSIPKVDIAVKIAKALDTSVEFLVTGKDDFLQKESAKIQTLMETYKRLPKEKQKLVEDLINSL